MNNSLKIGIAAGIISGLLGGILAIFHAISMFALGLPYCFAEYIPINQIVITEISLKIFLGIILGIIYSKFHNLISGKGYLKAFIFGLIFTLIYSVRWVTFDTMYGYPNMAISMTFSILVSFPMVFILGISYEFLSKRYHVMKEPAIVKHDLKSGFYPGALAGFVSGVGSFFYTALIINPLLWPKYMEDIGFLLSQLGTHAFFNMIWGIVFGILYVMFYEKIPGKGVLKGLVFGVILYVILTFVNALYFYSYGNYALGLWSLLAGPFVFIVFGLVMGLIYKKQPEASE